MRQGTRESDLAKFNDHDLALHRKLWQLAGNKYLYDALERAVVPLLTFFYLRSGRISDLHVESVPHHAALVDLLVSTEPAIDHTRQVLGSPQETMRRVDVLTTSLRLRAV